MKKMLCMILSLLLVLGLLAGCGSQAASSAPAAESAAASEEASAEAAAPAEEAAAAEEPAAEEALSAEEPAEEEAEEPAAPAHVLPLSDGSIEMSLFTGMNPNLMTIIDTYAEAGIFAWMEEQTGLKVNIPAIHPATQAEQWTLMLASGDFMDFLGAIGNYPGGAQGALDDEIIYDLNDYQDLMPLFYETINMSEEVRRDCTLDSGSVATTYRIVSNDEFFAHTSGPVLRKDWMDALNLDVPETYDEYHDVLTAFRDEYGATMWFSAGESPVLCHGYNIRAGYTFGMGVGLDCFYLKDDKVQCGFLSDEFNDYITMMQTWYKEGLLNPDFSMVSARYASSNTTEFGKVTTGKFGVWLEEAPSFAAYEPYGIELVGAPVPRLNKGDIITIERGYTRVDGAQFAISTTCEDPELAAEWLDYWYSDEATLMANWGIEGETFYYDENGEPHLTDLIMNNPQGIAMSFARELYTAPTGGYKFDQNTKYSLWGDAEFAACEVWNANDDPVNALPGMSMTTEESEEFNRLTGDLVTYVSENLSKLIMGDLSLTDGLDGFLQGIKDLGIERCVELEQIAYDRYSEK